jgi:hypothetical protein
MTDTVKQPKVVPREEWLAVQMGVFLWQRLQL